MTLSAICAAFGRTQHNARRRPAAVLAALALLLAVFSGCGGGSGTTTDTTPPTFAGVKSTTSMATSITLGWSPASDNVTAPWDIVYLVYRSPTSGFTPSPTNLIATTARGALSYDDTGLTAGSTYYYVVRAMDAAGNKDSNTVGIMGSTDTTPPVFAGITSATTPTAGTATPAGSVSTRLGWTAASDPDNSTSSIVYLVYRSTSAITSTNITSITPFTTAAGATAYTDTGLTQGTTYYYVVRAKDPAGNTDTNTVQLSTATLADTTPPTFAGATGTSSIGQTSATVNWTAATDNVSQSSAIIYLVYRSTTTTISYTTPIATTAAGAASYTDSTLSAGTTYYYVVHAKDEAGNEDANTAQVSAKTLSATTVVPTFAGASSLTVQNTPSLTIGWSPATETGVSSPSIQYLIYRATSSGGENFTVAPTYTSAVNATSFMDTNVTANTKYYYVVRAQDTSTGVTDTNTVEVFGPVSFLNDIYNPIIASGPSTCTTGCHAGAAPAGSLDLSTLTKAYNGMVNITSGECATAQYVVPGSSSTSYLYQKLVGTWPCGSGSQMPKTGTKLNATQLNTVKNWIDQGALNN